ncbi:putative CCR4-NOT complex subunit 10 [Tieghemostelium lacteum]|uniref:Putative CCR4-NOT complex subunit 10 n=1 Tax=Tieghemostelium lacteum TaxID=361077 RepID=A0A152A6U5_TIELA|nr:putative CCR4-NOT complex subunit 10 [Tieghemostelium lacteum]|eukprot:KYR01943.1 putative CCR4-NOT complex subunit 10 [Tieghemostelium lacteum]
MNNEELQSIANTAINHFQKKEYEKSTELFQDLKTKTNSTNYEVLMNLSISEFYKNNRSNPSKLLDDLSTIYKSVTSVDSNNSSNSVKEKESSSTSSPTSNSTTTTQTPNQKVDTPLSPSTNSTIGPNIQSDSLLPLNTTIVEIDNDQALILYNQSVVLYLIKQYGTCYANLDILYQNLLFLDDYLAIRICFLLINVCLTSQYYDKATSVLFYLEKTFPHLYYIKESNSNTNNETSNNNNNNNNTLMTPLEFRFMIHFYKSKLYLLSENSYHLAKFEIKNAIDTALTINHSLLPSCYLLKSNYYNHYSSTKYHKTIEYLNKSTLINNNNENNNNSTTKPLSFGIDLHFEEITPQFYYNNLGSLHFNLDKFSSSLFYFSKAFDCENQNQQQQQSQQQFKNVDKKTELFYNIAMVLMVVGKPDLAFSCLQESCLHWYSSPLIWLRLAECCILTHLSKLKSEQDTQSDQQIKYISDPTTGTARFILPTTSSKHQGLQLMEDSGLDETDDLSKLGTLSLEFAAKCLRNANYLQSKVLHSLKKSKDQQNQLQQLNNDINNTINSTTSTNNNMNTNNSSSNGTPTDLYQNNPNELMFSILVSQAYISLCTWNPVITITVTRQLLALCSTLEKEDLELNDCKTTSKTQPIDFAKFKYYAHMYAAEACIMLNLPTQAIDFLSPTFIDSIQQNNNIVQNDFKEVFYINLAIAYLLKNDFENADKTIQFINNLTNLNINITHKFNMIKIYVELRKGNYHNAYNLIAKQRPVPLDITETDNID